MTTIAPGGMVERHYLGYVKVLVPDAHSSSGMISASEISGLGLRVGNGVGVGYFNEREVITPLDCRVVFFVKDRRQLDEAVNLLRNTAKENNICAAIF